MKRPSNIVHNQLRSVAAAKIIPLKVQSKQMMKDLVTDYIIRSFSGSSQALARQRQRKYQPIPAIIEINGKTQQFEFPLFSILQKYGLQYKSAHDGDSAIEPLLTSIMQFIDKLEDKISVFSLDFDGTPSTEAVLTAIIIKHIRNKQKQQLQGEYEQAQQKISTKHKKVSFDRSAQKAPEQHECNLLIENESEASTHKLSRMSFQSAEHEQIYKKYAPTPATSKLKQLVDSCNIFDHPQKIEDLRREKIIAELCKDELEYTQAQQICRKKPGQYGQSSLNPGTAKMLEDWISQINLSEYLFKKRYGLTKQNSIPQTNQQEESSSDNE